MRRRSRSGSFSVSSFTLGASGGTLGSALSDVISIPTAPTLNGGTLAAHSEGENRGSTFTSGNSANVLHGAGDDVNWLGHCYTSIKVCGSNKEQYLHLHIQLHIR